MKKPYARLASLLLATLFASAAGAVEMSNRYRSPRNPERTVRKSTDLIVLHTTEAPARSSLTKLSDRGEAHFCVTEDGTIYRIVDRDREAFHAGRSMWNGREDVDKFSIGIECVGYHDKAMPMAQIVAIRNLVKELQAMYRLSDDKVVCHSHVAYGAPNKWHRARHRGRKRCGMLFAMPSVRSQLGLKARPASDLDVKARRLVVGDQYLNNVLYSRVDTMARHYGANGAAPAAPAKKPGWFSRLLGGMKGDASPAPAAPAKAAPAPNPQVRAVKAAPHRPPGTIADLKARGYVQKGVVSREKTAIKIAGSKWNSPDTYYTIRNKVVPGSAINAAKIEKGMVVWMRP